MPRARKFNRKKFQGDQFDLSTTRPTSEIGLSQTAKKSSSNKKLSGSKLPKDYDISSDNVNIIVNVA